MVMIIMAADLMIVAFYSVLTCHIARGFLLQSGPTCYQCEFAFSPESCSTKHRCSNDQKCYTERLTAPDNSNVYRLGCISNHACNTSGGSLCFGCCTGSLCNKNVCQIGTCPSMYYGPACTERCGRCLNGYQCDKTTGMCPNGCEDGYVAPFCRSGCPSPWYGRACSHLCGLCSGGLRCNVQNGVCARGCERGFIPPLCTEERKVRLMNGSSPREGRLEVLHDDVWGTVCYRGFTSAAAGVACRQLGLRSDGAVVLRNLPSGQETVRIWLDNVRCNGDEATLEDCANLMWGTHNCDHSGDVGIRCDRSIRLVNGSSSLEGRLEITHEGVWGTICDDSFTNQAAGVACRELGFASVGALAYPEAHFGQGIGTIWLDDVRCQGNEATITNCGHTTFGTSNCQHGEDVGIRCSRNIRLVNGSSKYEGRLEILHENAWGTVCGFTNEAAGVACRQLGFASDRAVAFSDAKFGQGILPTWLDDVTCRGDETSIQECQHREWGDNDCGHQGNVGISCLRNIRLLNGSSLLEGRLEIFHENVWGTIMSCDDGFTTETAGVACRQLGFARDGAQYIPNAQFGSGTSHIWLDDVTCGGGEMSIQDCQHRGWGSHDCSYHGDVGIRCTRNIRLVGGPSSNEGRLEVFYENAWGTVCDDDFTNETAEVACRQLGFPSDEAQFYLNAHYGAGNTSIWLDDVRCVGNEESLKECAHSAWGTNNCGHTEDVGINCANIVRLAGGNSLTEGRVEVYVQGQWGTVCDDAFDNLGATVVCRMLGFAGSAIAQPTAFYGVGVGTIWLDQVTCNGREVSIEDCSHNGWGIHDCSHGEDVGVRCSH